MDRFEHFKLFQFSFSIVYFIISCVLLFNKEIKQAIFSNRATTVLFFLIWILIVCQFLFLLIDYKLLSYVKSGSKALYGAAYSDQLTQMPNRFSCDTIIEKYQTEKLPIYFTCAMIQITNLQEINHTYSHSKGNTAIKDFSSILLAAAGDYGFIGRNGGNTFLAIFEHGDPITIEEFFQTLSDKVEEYNHERGHVKIEFAYGFATHFKEQCNTINELISLANQRIHA